MSSQSPLSNITAAFIIVGENIKLLNGETKSVNSQSVFGNDAAREECPLQIIGFWTFIYLIINVFISIFLS